MAGKWSQDETYTVEAAAITGALISLLIKGVLFWGLIRLVHSFGQGLRERSEFTVSLSRVENTPCRRRIFSQQVSK